MGLTGKYDFEGIKKQNARGLRALLLAIPWLAWLPKLPLSQPLFELLANLLANRGLVFLNDIAYHVNGEIDQAALDKSINDGLARIEKAGGVGNISPEEGKAIDDAVIKAADKALPYGRKPSKP